MEKKEMKKKEKRQKRCKKRLDTHRPSHGRHVGKSREFANLVR
jgi:hypothetical protein